MKADMKKEDSKAIKLALLGQLMSVMSQHALKGCMDEKEDEKPEAVVVVEPEDESKMDDKAKRLKKLKALAGE